MFAPRLRVALVGVALCGALLGSSSPVQASACDDARRLADQAFDQWKQGKNQEAASMFQRASELCYTPVIELFRAKAVAKQGKLLAARAITQGILDRPRPEDPSAPWLQGYDQARAFATELDGRIPTVRIRLSGSDLTGATAELDGATAEPDTQIQVDPGEHTVRATNWAGASDQRTVQVSEGGEATIELMLGEVKDEGDDSSRWIAPGIAFGIGGAGLIVGAISGIIFIGKANELGDSCSDDICPPDKADLIDETLVLGNIATVGWIVAGVGAVAGATLLLIPTDADEPEAEARAPRLHIRPMGASLELRF